MDWKPAPRRRTPAGIGSATEWVNHHLNQAPEVPFGSSKRTGIGYENGHWGFAEFSGLLTVRVAQK